MREGIDCDIEQADLCANTHMFSRASAVLASVDTLKSGAVDKKRMQRFNPKDFGLLLYDESHHSVSPGNKSIVDYFTQGNPDLKVLGVTATATRHDELALGQIFETVAAERDILFGISEGWLCNIEQLFVATKLDWSHVRTTAGDLNGRDLANVMESESAVQQVVQPTLEALYRIPAHALDTVPVPEWGAFLSQREGMRRAIVFASSVAHSEMLCNVFNRVINNVSGFVCGKTADQQRAEVLDDFKTGRKAILVNCGVTTEGYDNPFVDLIVMARPTKSQGLYTQMVGRGTRPLPGLIDGLATADERKAAIASSAKPMLTVMDFCGNSGKHKLMSTADILGGKYPEETIDRAIAKAKKDGSACRMVDVIAEEEEKRIKELERRRLIAEAAKRQVVARTQYSSRIINPFDVLQIEPARSRGWDNGKQLSPKQRALLAKHMGVNPDEISYAQGRQLLVEQFRRWDANLCSIKQASVIKKHYPEIDAKNLPRKEASAMIDALSKNGWKRPAQAPAPVKEPLPF
jgi:superfamily II DNA or RNA helicase